CCTTSRGRSTRCVTWSASGRSPRATSRRTSGRWRSCPPVSRGTTCTMPTRPVPGTACSRDRSTSRRGRSGSSRSSAGRGRFAGRTSSALPGSRYSIDAAQRPPGEHPYAAVVAHRYEVSPGSGRSKVGMTGKERREQLLDVGRGLLAAKGFGGTSIEEIAHRAGVSKPVVYEHFGGKEGLYAAVVDREMERLLTRMTSALSGGGHPRELLERAAVALLDYIEDSTDGFHILVRDSPVASSPGTLATLP